MGMMLISVYDWVKQKEAKICDVSFRGSVRDFAAWVRAVVA